MEEKSFDKKKQNRNILQDKRIRRWRQVDDWRLKKKKEQTVGKNDAAVVPPFVVEGGVAGRRVEDARV